jgi:hypothetical protein
MGIDEIQGGCWLAENGGPGTVIAPSSFQICLPVTAAVSYNK